MFIVDQSCSRRRTSAESSPSARISRPCASSPMPGEAASKPSRSEPGSEVCSCCRVAEDEQPAAVAVACILEASKEQQGGVCTAVRSHLLRPRSGLGLLRLCGAAHQYAGNHLRNKLRSAGRTRNAPTKPHAVVVTCGSSGRRQAAPFCAQRSVRHPPGNECSLQNRFLHCLQVPLVAAFRRCLQPSTGHFAAFSLGGMGLHRPQRVGERAAAVDAVKRQPATRRSQSAARPAQASLPSCRAGAPETAYAGERRRGVRRCAAAKSSGAARQRSIAPYGVAPARRAGEGRTTARPGAAAQADTAPQCAVAVKCTATKPGACLALGSRAGARCALRTGSALQILALVSKASGQGALVELVPPRDVQRDAS